MDKSKKKVPETKAAIEEETKKKAASVPRASNEASVKDASQKAKGATLPPTSARVSRRVEDDKTDLCYAEEDGKMPASTSIENEAEDDTKDMDQPGAVRVEGFGGATAADDEQALEPPGTLTAESQELTKAELVSAEDIVAAVPTVPWYKQRKVECLVGVMLLIVIGLTVGLVIPLTRSDDNNDKPLENDQCKNALELLAIPSTTEGTTIGSNMDTIETCGSANGGQILGVWYTVVGTGDMLSVSTCTDKGSFDTQLSVFAGDCDELECIDGNDDACGKQSRVTWPSVADKSYYIFVHGNGVTGDFELNIEKGPENDECQDAIEVVVPSSVKGSTSAASIVEVPNCVTARVCAHCIYDGMEDFCACGTCAENEEELCEILEGCRDICGSSCLNAFEGLNDCIWQLHPDIISMGCGGFTCGSGKTRDFSSFENCSHLDDELNTCAGNAKPPGIWYKIEGTGRTISVSTCNEETTFDTQLSVFAGSCSNLQCMDGNDDACDNKSRASWVSVLGETYYILVHGKGVTGDFQLDIEEGPENDVCENAEGPLLIPSLTDGSTSQATLEQVSKCGSAWEIDSTTFVPILNDVSRSDAPGVWYSVVGTGSFLSVSTGCNNLTTLDTQISLFTGSCTSLECIDGNDDFECEGEQIQSRVSWNSIAGTTYFVLVHGYRETGDFQLQVEDLGLPIENDECTDAIGPLMVPSSTQGSTKYATTDTVDDCGGAEGGSGPGIWYTLLGMGNTIVASTCNDATKFDTQIAVFAGDCGSLECIWGSDDGEGCDSVQSRVAWNGEEGVTYYILVSGFEGATGNFTLDITSN